MTQVDHHKQQEWERAREQEIVDQEETEAEIAKEMEKERLKLESKEAYARGGIKFADRRMITFQRKVFISFVKSLGMKLVNRQDLSRISMPVKLFEPRSYLQRLTDAWVHMPTVFKGMADATPIEQMKSVITFSVSGLIQTVSNWKPFNPILGETFQCSLHDGTKVQLEQTSHHPPISNQVVEAPNDEWVFTGRAEQQSSQKGNSAKGTQGGLNQIRFRNGTTITFTNPEFWLNGILWGERVAEYRGTVMFEDKHNGIEAKLEFDPDRISYLKSFFYNAKTPSDYFRGQIVVKPNRSFLSSNSNSKGKDKTSDTNESNTANSSGVTSQLQQTATSTVSAATGTAQNSSNNSANLTKSFPFSGSWLTHISFDENKKYFDIESFKFPEIIDHPNPLPSDSRYRIDLVALQEGNYKKSQACKVELEEKQRRDRRLRAQYSGNAVTPISGIVSTNITEQQNANSSESELSISMSEVVLNRIDSQSSLDTSSTNAVTSKAKDKNSKAKSTGETSVSSTNKSVKKKSSSNNKKAQNVNIKDGNVDNEQVKAKDKTKNKSEPSKKVRNQKG